MALRRVVLDQYTNRHYLEKFYVPKIVKDAFDDTNIMLKMADFNINKLYDEDGTFTITYYISKGFKTYLGVNFWFPKKLDKYSLGWIDVYRYCDQNGNRLYCTDQSGNPINGSEVYHKTYRLVKDMEAFIREIPTLV
jgi:hypothetical protein